MTAYLLNPDLIGMAALSAAVALAMALFAAPRIGRVTEKSGDGNANGAANMSPQFASALARIVTIWSGTLCGLAVLWSWGWKVGFFWEHRSLLEQMLVGGAAVTLLGLINDAFALRRHQLFAGQCLVALLLIATGLVVREVAHTEWVFTLGVFGIPATMVWLVLTINSLSLLRKSSGLAIIDGLLLTAAMLAYSASQHYLSVSLWCCLLCGSLAGLLLFNAPRWRTALGPTATTLVGVHAGILAVHAASSGHQQIRYIPAMIFAAIPLVIFLIHVVKRGFTRPAAASSAPKTAAHAAVTAAVCTPERTTRHGRQSVPMAPIISKPASSPAVRTELSPDESGILRVSGTRDWAPLWETLCALGKEYDLSEFELQVAIPALNEAYHARKRRYRHRDRDPLWRMEIPLYVGDRHVGKLLLTGMSRREPYSQWMGRVASGLRPFEIHLLAVMESHSHLPAALVAPPPLELRMLASEETEPAASIQATDVNNLPPIVRRDEIDAANAERLASIRIAN
ncbi:MAG: hypothetical protein WEB58_00260 [Planctomycetaceae bacterium]